MAEVGPSFDTSGLALKSEVPTAASQPSATVIHAVALEP